MALNHLCLALSEIRRVGLCDRSFRSFDQHADEDVAVDPVEPELHRFPDKVLYEVV